MDLARDSFVFKSAKLDIHKSFIYIFVRDKWDRLTFLFLFLM